LHVGGLDVLSLSRHATLLPPRRDTRREKPTGGPSGRRLRAL